MALKATVIKTEVQVSDLDRGHYQTHSFTLAQHPSETAQRLMVRLLAFVLNVDADERLAFGRGLSTEDEPDLWLKDLTGEILLWIEVGQPDEARLRRACGRARQVRVYNYGGRAADLWWERSAEGLQRLRNLEVFDVPAAAVDALAALHARQMDLQCVVQEGLVQLMDAQRQVELELRQRLPV